MAALDPDASWWLKVERAHQHLADVKTLLDSVRDDHLTTVRVEKQKEGDVWAYTAHLGIEPPPMLSLAVGDFLFNMASALDHIATANAVGGIGRQVNFPIFTIDVRNLTGKEAQTRSKWRKNWNDARDALGKPVFAVIEQAQPFIPGNSGAGGPDHHSLAVLKDLHNADKHEELNIFAFGLSDLVGVVGEGVKRESIPFGGQLTRGGMLADGAKFYASPREVKVSLAGTVQVAVRGGRVTDHFDIPKTLDHIVHTVSRVLREIEAVT